VQERLAKNLGGESLALLGRAYDLAEELVGGTDPNVAGLLEARDSGLTPTALKDAALRLGVDYVVTRVAPEIAARLVTQLFPVLKPVGTVYNVLKWMLKDENRRALKGAFDRLKDGLDGLIAGRTDAVRDAVKGALEAALGPFIDLAARELNLGRVRDAVQRAVQGVKPQVNQALDRVLAGLARQARVLQALGAAGAGGFAGQVGGRAGFRVGNADYQLWAAKRSNAVQVMLSGPGGLAVSLSTDPHLPAGASAAQKALIAGDLAGVRKAADDVLKAQREKNFKRVAQLQREGQPLDRALTKLKIDLPNVGCTCFGGACFAAGTPLLTPGGAKPIEQFRPGDLVLSRAEAGPVWPVEPRAVEEVFVRRAELLEVRLGGRALRTTAEHPFWVVGKGWQTAEQLNAGDELLGHDGGRHAVEAVAPTGEVATVYNLRVAEHHTYFVAAPGGGAFVWAHNQYFQAETGSFLRWFRPALTAARKPLANVPLVATLNLSDPNWRTSDLTTYLANNRNKALVYVLADRRKLVDGRSARSTEKVLKVGKTVASNWSSRLGDYRAWALAGSYWSRGAVDAQQLVLYVYAVDAGRETAVERKVRKALYGAGQRLPRDYSARAENGQWFDFYRHPRGGGYTVEQAPVGQVFGQVLQGTLFEAAAGDAVHIDLNYISCGPQLTNLQQGGGDFVYLLEDRDGPNRLQVLNADFREAKIGDSFRQT
jgi:hypothetical protein